MSIYTGRGDEGETDLRDMSRVSKSSHRIEAYGSVDEANALLGTIRPTGHDDVDDLLETIQNHLHIVQADLANPDPDPEDPQVESEHTEALEAHIDAFDEELEPLTSFILPGGGEAGAPRGGDHRHTSGRSVGASPGGPVRASRSMSGSRGATG